MKQAQDSTQQKDRTVITSCPHDCGGRCVLKVHVTDGIITKIETDNDDEPQLRACVRGRAYRQRVYAPDRLQYPMKRVGERGEGKFERISWEEALDTVASKLKSTKETYGNDAIFYVPYSGNTGTLLHSQLAVFRMLNMFGGFTSIYGSCSFWGSIFSSNMTYGTLVTGHTRDDLVNSNFIIMWGWNPAESIQRTNTALCMAKAKEKGIKIVAVDPRFTDSIAAFADEWVPIRPGTDTAMLLAMMNVIINNNYQDQTFIDSFTVGYEKLKAHVLGEDDHIPKTPEWAAEITGVPAKTIEWMATEYATNKPSALLTLGAPGRTAFGEQFHRAASSIAALTANVGIHGGESAGFGLAPVGMHPMSSAGLLKGSDMSRLINTSKPQGIHLTKAWDAIIKGKEGGYENDIKLVYITNGNPVNQFLNTNKAVRALKKAEFVVVHEQFMTATAKFADILLPINTHLERNDIIRPWHSGSYYIYMGQAIENMYECKSDMEVCGELAKRLDIEGYSDKTEDEWLRDLYQTAQDLDPKNPLVDYDELKKKGVHKIKLDGPAIAFKEQIQDPENNPFPTKSGKIEIYSEQMQQMKNPKLPPIPKYIETWESLNDPLAKTYPLQLITTHNTRRVNANWDNIPWLYECTPQTVWISSADAKARGIGQGDMVRIFNQRGEVALPAKVTERMMPGVINIAEGGWFKPDKKGVDRGGCCNVLLKDEHSPAGAFCSNTCLVQVQKENEGQ